MKLEETLRNIPRMSKRALTAMALVTSLYGCGDAKPSECCEVIECYEYNEYCDMNPSVNGYYTCIETKDGEKECCTCQYSLDL